MGGRPVFCFIICFLFQFVSGRDRLCENNTQITRSCTTQILGEEYVDDDSCKVEYIPSNSSKCMDNFGPISSDYQIGQVILKPYILPVRRRDFTITSVNYTILNISFTNIKWKTMKFRFQKDSVKYEEGYCRNIVISNDVRISDQSVLYYDCYWSANNGNYKGQSHVFDFEASDDSIVNRGRIHFNIPTSAMLDPGITEEDWKPFVYIEILSNCMKLHIMPPPTQLKITAYQIEVIKKCDKGTQCDEIVKNPLIKSKNNTQEVTYDFSLSVSSGFYYFVVTPIHEKCKNGEMECQSVESPRIFIDGQHEILNICIASIAALVVGTLFISLFILLCIRRYWCKEYAQEIPPPTKVLVIYSPTSRLHADCVASFVAYLRSEYGFEVMYDGDISSTSHGDPFVWAEEAFRLSSHVIYVVGPAENTNLYNNIYDKPIIVHKDVDILLLSLLRTTRTSKCPKQIINVFFGHSNGTVPIETRHDKKFVLLKDWQKLIAYLSKNLLPKKQIMRSEKGKDFLDDLSRATKLLNSRNDDVVIRCEKNINEKKVLL